MLTWRILHVVLKTFSTFSLFTFSCFPRYIITLALLCVFVRLPVRRITQKLLNQFSEQKSAEEAVKKTLDFDGKTDHVALRLGFGLGLGLRQTFHVTRPDAVSLRLAEGRVTFRNTE